MARRSEPQPALGRAIRRLRTERDLSQEELGHLAEIHPTWISHIESGRTNPAWGTVRRIAQVFEVRLSEIVLVAERLADEERGQAEDEEQS
jgi:transcriptional regulator with XRE-family HTH domain